ncbi:MAG: hypothetical protein AAB263_15465 [Planctomycetota bacterium]
MTTPICSPYANTAAMRTAIGPWLAVDPVPVALVCGIAEKAESAGWSGFITDADEVRTCFTSLSALDPQYQTWNAQFSDATYQRLAAAIRWFRIDVEQLTGKAKLSQNNPPARQQKVIDRLRASTDPADQGIATAMTRTLSGQTPWPITAATP